MMGQFVINIGYIVGNKEKIIRKVVQIIAYVDESHNSKKQEDFD